MQLLGELPLDTRVAECGDNGEPIVQKFPDSPIARSYLALARSVVEELKHGDPGTDLPPVNL